MANQISNYVKGMLFKGQIAGISDNFKIILMKSGFVYDKDTYQDYSDVSTNEVDNGNGYTTEGLLLTGAAVTVSITLDNAVLSWSNAQWIADGGSIVASGAIIYDDSTATPNDDYTDAIMTYIDFGGDITTVDGQILKVTNINIAIT
jgi:hypothetical protein